MTLTIALISDTFYDHDAPARLEARLAEARARGATLALLPEIPLNPWSPATTTARTDDAEPPFGERHHTLGAAARATGVAVVGGAIVIDPETGRRHNTALVFDGSGAHVASYRKMVLPEEEGFWETSHYEPGDALSPVLTQFGLGLGLQICSDMNRPEGAHLLGAQGAEVIVNPRATEAATFARWRTVLMASALTSCTYVLSVNRPREEQGVALGGPSFAVAPTGEVLCETLDPVAVVTLDRAVVAHARTRYPGYLATRADLYARAWAGLGTTRYPNERSRAGA
jgi:N-carbamoylputrescine amidase